MSSRQSLELKFTYLQRNTDAANCREPFRPVQPAAKMCKKDNVKQKTKLSILPKAIKVLVNR